MSDDSFDFGTYNPPTPSSDEFAEYVKEMADDLAGQTLTLDEGTFEPTDTLNADSPHTLQRRKLLNILNKLHRTGVQQDIDLPQIVVIGSQSVGKSSLIEAMSGITLPRDSGTCTRCPMECKLTYSPESWKCSIFLRFQVDNDGKPLAKVIETPFGKALTDKDEVAGMLRRAQRAILRPALNSKLFLDDTDQDILEPAPLSFSANCVCLRVSGPQVPDLFFYDLPGIIATVGERGDPRDIELIRNLVKKYISKERCLVLLTVSCETDFENQGAVMLAKQYDRFGKRIIGVLTKPDRIEHTGGGRWLAMIRNEENELENGWFAVKLPSPSELLDKVTWEEARAREIAFFREQKPWNTISAPHSNRLGSRQLAGNLSCLLSKLFVERLPQIEKELRLAYGKVEQELTALPAPVYEDTSATVTGLVFRFCQEVSRRIEGTVQFPGMQLGLMQSIHQAHLKFKTDIRNTAPKFCPWEKTAGVVVIPVVPPVPTGSNKKKKGVVVPPPSSNAPSHTLLSEPQRTNWVKDPDFISSEEHSGDFYQRVGSIFYLDEVMQAAEDSISRELPGDYPFSVKEELIKLFIKEWREPMLSCFNSIATLLKNHINEVITEYFGPYVHGGLLAAVKTIVNTLLLKLQRSTLAKLESHLIREGQPSTINSNYFNHFKTNFMIHYRDIRRQSQGKDSLIQRLQRSDGNLNTAIQYLHNFGFGFTITPTDLARLIPAESMEPALDIMATVRAYFQVAYKRFLDAIPMEIDTEFVRGFDVQIREGLILGLQVGSQTKCNKWLSEPPAIVAKRKELEATRKRLLDARKELAALAFGKSED